MDLLFNVFSVLSVYNTGELIVLLNKGSWGILSKAILKSKNLGSSFIKGEIGGISGKSSWAWSFFFTKNECDNAVVESIRLEGSNFSKLVNKSIPSEGTLVEFNICKKEPNGVVF